MIKTNKFCSTGDAELGQNIGLARLVNVVLCTNGVVMATTIVFTLWLTFMGYRDLYLSNLSMEQYKVDSRCYNSCMDDFFKNNPGFLTTTSMSKTCADNCGR